MAQPEYGSFESYPARFTDTEAWVFINGEWKSFHPAEMAHGAGVMTEAAYIDLFGQVPALPKTAFQSDV